jgi:hypothetical protein
MKSIIVTTDHRYSFNTRSNNLSKDLQIYSDIFKLIPFTWIVDRTGSANLPFHTHLIGQHKLDPEIEPTKSFDEICQETVEKYKNITGQIYILWSGGIDSTLLLVSFLKSDIDKNKIVVACNFDSIKEYHSFYKNHILPNFQIISVDRFIADSNYDSINGVVLTGDPCDVLFGNDLALDVAKNLGFDYLKKPCSRENVVNYLEKKNFDIESANCWYDYFMHSVPKSPKEIKTMQDYSWWEGFNHRWQAANEKIKIRFSTENSKKCIQFFDTNQFQSWAINNNQMPLKSFNDLKLESKKIIFEFTKDQHYYDNKIKLHSNSYVFGLNSHSVTLDDDQRLTANEFNIFDFYNQNNFINDWISC